MAFSNAWNVRIDAGHFSYCPVPNKWGAHGWANINLKKVRVSTLRDALRTAYSHTAPKRLGALEDEMKK